MIITNEYCLLGTGNVNFKCLSNQQVTSIKNNLEVIPAQIRYINYTEPTLLDKK